MVPIDIATSTDPSKPINSQVLTDKSLTVTLDNVKPSDWIKVSTDLFDIYF